MRGLDLKKMDYLGGFQFQVTENLAPNCSKSRLIRPYISKLRLRPKVLLGAKLNTLMRVSVLSLVGHCLLRTKVFFLPEPQDSHNGSHHHGAFCPYLMGGESLQAGSSLP